jgi:hypothetical protein
MGREQSAHAADAQDCSHMNVSTLSIAHILADQAAQASQIRHVT